MAFSRFYQPVQTQYVSQFVPENLGVYNEALKGRQKAYDETARQLDLFNDALLQQQALPKHDEEVLKTIKSDVENFSSEMSNLDLSLPENKRKVSKYIKQLASDERLSKIQQGVESRNKYLKIKEDLTKKNKLVPHNDMIFMKAYENYLNQEGDGQQFGIDFIGGKEIIPEHIPFRPELEKFVDNAKASGVVYNEENGTWMDKYSNKELSFNQLFNTLDSNIEPFSQTPAGMEMARKAEMNDVSFQEQFIKEITPVAQERAYSETSHIKTDNTARLKRLQEMQDNQSIALVQKGKTAGYFTNFESIDDYKGEIKKLKNTKKPEDLKRAAEMEGQMEEMNNRFFENLPENKKGIMLYSPPKGSPAYEEAKEDVLKGNIYGVSVKDLDNKIIERARELKAKEYKINYNELKKERDEFIQKGEIFEADDIILTASTGSNKARENVAEQAKTAFNSINSDIKSSTKKDIKIEDTVNSIDRQSIKITRGINGPETSYRYKDEDGKFQYITIVSKDLGNNLQETTLNLYETLSGKDPYLFQALKESHMYSGLNPIGSNSDYNQKQDIFQYLPENTRNKLDVFSDLKIVREKGHLKLIGKGQDSNGNNIKLNIEEPSIADLIDTLIENY